MTRALTQSLSRHRWHLWFDLSGIVSNEGGQARAGRKAFSYLTPNKHTN